MFKSVGEFDTLLPELSRPGSREDIRYDFCYTAPVESVYLETFFFNQAINICELRLLKRNSINGLQ